MSSRTPFIRPVYQGERFVDHGMPVELLPDLAAYQDLVVELAGELFKQEHPNRRRLPKNFSQGFQLELRTVEPGSAIPCVDRVTHGANPPMFDVDDYFEEARDLIGATMAAAARDEALPRAFPLELLPRFNRIGQGLRNDESITWCPGTERDGPRYDRRLRKRLVLQRTETYEQQVDLIGLVVAHDMEKFDLDIRTDGQRVKVRFSSSDASTVRAILGNDEPVVRVTGVGLFDARDELKGVTSIHTIDLVETTDTGQDTSTSLLVMLTRLAELSELPDGWLDGDGTRYSEDLLNTAGAVFARWISAGVAVPQIVPTPEGEVRAEWLTASFSVSANLHASGTEVYLHASPGLNRDYDEATVPANDVDATVAFFMRYGLDKKGEIR